MRCFSSLRILGGYVRIAVFGPTAAKGNLSLILVIFIIKSASVFVNMLTQIQLAMTRIIPVQLVGIDEMLEFRVNHPSS